MGARTQAHALAATLLVAALASTPTAHGDDGTQLGRIFFTPQERAMLDRQRPNAAADTVPGISNDQSPQNDSRVNRVVLNGVVRREHRETIVWINGQPAEVAAGRLRGLQIRQGPDSQNRVTLEAGRLGARARLKPGQTWDVATGTVMDCLRCAGRPSAPPKRALATEPADAATPDGGGAAGPAGGPSNADESP